MLRSKPFEKLVTHTFDVDENGKIKRGGEEEMEYKNPGEEIVNRAKKYQRKHPEVSYEQAAQAILEEDPDLGEAYKNDLGSDDARGHLRSQIEASEEIERRAFDHPGVCYEDASRTVLEEDPELAKKYAV
jgi:hypothetical protein